MQARLFESHVDDLVRTEVRPVNRPLDRELAFSLRTSVIRAQTESRALTAAVRVHFRRDGRAEAAEPPAELARYVAVEPPSPGPPPPPPEAARPRQDGEGDEIRRRLVPEGANSFLWQTRIPYFYCHYSARMLHSGYLRVMEEVVDRFLADRGIPVGGLLSRKRWVPVVADVQLRLLREAFLEETLVTVYTVEDVFKNLTYTARMDCYVPRGGDLVHTATGGIRRTGTSSSSAGAESRSCRSTRTWSPRRQGEPTMSRPAARYYFSFRSPYSWIATRVLEERLPGAYGGEIEYVPTWEPDDRTATLLGHGDGDNCTAP